MPHEATPQTPLTAALSGWALARLLPAPTAFELSADMGCRCAEMERDAARTTAWLLVRIVGNWSLLSSQ